MLRLAGERLVNALANEKHPVVDGMGGFFAVTSYCGELFISPTACRDIVPDPEFLCECIDRSYREMLESVQVDPGEGQKPVEATSAKGG